MILSIGERSWKTHRKSVRRRTHAAVCVIASTVARLSVTITLSPVQDEKTAEGKNDPGRNTHPSCRP